MVKTEDVIFWNERFKTLKTRICTPETQSLVVGTILNIKEQRKLGKITIFSVNNLIERVKNSMKQVEKLKELML